MIDDRADTDRRTAIVTGVSRRVGIGFTIARRLLDANMNVLIQSWSAHDAEMPWGAEPIDEVVDALGGVGPRLDHLEADFAADGEPERVVARAVERFGHADVLVANHARSSRGGLADAAVNDLDLAWKVNARATVMLTKAFAAQHDEERGDGRVILFTSGQHLAPMSDEIAYAISKGAVHQMALTLADALADHGITVNAINPGPVDTGYADEATRAHVAKAFPRGRWGQPADIANVVAWLASRESDWITGQVIDVEGGFRRFAS
jgi:3-oxoacyl-[acyl-carrier protein] reductase